MDQLNTALNGNINNIVVFTLLLLTLSLAILVGAAVTLIPQVSRTLGAFERLMTTLDTELEPTLVEANKLFGGILKIQDMAQTGVAGVQTKVEDVTGNITKAAGDAQKHSWVLGAGLTAAVRAYLEAKPEKKDHDKTSGDDRAKTDRGEKNVGQHR
jgi:uncharacterized protein YoxC